MPLIVPADPNMVTVILPADLLAKIEARAEKKHQPMQDYIIHALQQYTK